MNHRGSIRPRRHANFAAWASAVIALSLAPLGPGCGAPPRPPEVSDLPARHRLDGYQRSFLLLARGATSPPSAHNDRLGEVRESIEEQGIDGPLTYTRREKLSVLREDTLVEITTVITIEMNQGLRPYRVVVRRSSENTTETMVAARERDGSWRVDLGRGEPLHLDAEVGVAEVELFRTSGDEAPPRKVMLPGYRFAVVPIAVSDAEAGRELRFTTPWGPLRAELRYDRDHLPLEIQSSSGVSARAVDEPALTARYKAVDVLGRAAIEVEGELQVGRPVQVELALARPVAPAATRLELVAGKTSWRSRDPRQPAPALASAGKQQLEELVTATHGHLAPSLGPTAATASDALAHGRGDCNAHTLVFLHLAAAEGLKGRVVSGYRLDGRRLVRHRWAAVLLDGGWQEVDPTFGEVPASGVRLGLAMTAVNDGELALLDDLLFPAFADARARFVASPSSPP